MQDDFANRVLQQAQLDKLSTLLPGKTFNFHSQVLTIGGSGLAPAPVAPPAGRGVDVMVLTDAADTQISVAATTEGAANGFMLPQSTPVTLACTDVTRIVLYGTTGTKVYLLTRTLP